MSMDMDERWLNRPPQVMVETFHGFQGELFDLFVEDLLTLPTTVPILAEGFTLLPRLVAPLLSSPGQAIWLVPTPGFHRAACDSRGSTWEFQQDIRSRTDTGERAISCSDLCRCGEASGR